MKKSFVVKNIKHASLKFCFSIRTL